MSEPGLFPRTDRIVRWFQAHPIVAYGTLALLLITTALGLIGFLRDGAASVDRRFFWRDNEYGTLTRLHSDYTDRAV